MRKQVSTFEGQDHRAFIRDLPQDEDDSAIAEAIIAMAHRLKIKVVAEGVETEQQLAFLRHHGCDVLQGFLLGRPMPFSDAGRYLADRGWQKMLKNTGVG